MANRLKITVVKRLSNQDLIDEYGVDVKSQCEVVKDGQEFMVEGLNMPEGFCAWAWADIQRDVAHLFLDGDFPWVKEKGVMISACTDGFRPVIFKLERLPDDQG